MGFSVILHSQLQVLEVPGLHIEDFKCYHACMKARVDFYLSKATHFQECRQLVCFLAEKCYQQGHSAIVHLESKEETEILDQLLWTFRPESFLPHQITSPLTITMAKLNENNLDALIINDCLPAHAEPLKLARLLQIVPNQINLRELAREHYRFYKQQGYQLFTHEIK